MTRKYRKSRKPLFFLLFMLFFFILGLTYANENKILNIDGRVSAKIDTGVAFVESNFKRSNCEAKANTNISGSIINIDITGLSKPEDFISLDLSIKNIGTIDVKINTITINGLQEYEYIKVSGFDMNTVRRLNHLRSEKLKHQNLW